MIHRTTQGTMRNRTVWLRRAILQYKTSEFMLINRGIGYNFFSDQEGVRGCLPLLAEAQRNIALCKAQFSPSS